MFNDSALKSFFSEFRNTFTRVETLRTRLASRFHDADEAINAVILAALCNYPCLLFGPPGVAKSRLIRTFCEHIGIDVESGDGDRYYFEYLLTQFTEPTELFGPFRLETNQDGVQFLERTETGMLHKCRVAFLDEVFNGSSAILNALLALMNEGLFHDRGQIKRSSLELIFGATNGFRDTDTALAAIFDRFVIRCHMGNVDSSPEAYGDYLKQAIGSQSKPKMQEVDQGLLDACRAVASAYTAMEAHEGASSRLLDFSTEQGEKFLENLAYIISLLRQKRVATFSNRRVYQLLRALTMQRLMRAAREGGIGDSQLVLDDYQIIWSHFLDTAKPLQSDVQLMLENLPNMPPTSGSRS